MTKPTVGEIEIQLVAATPGGGVAFTAGVCANALQAATTKARAKMDVRIGLTRIS